MAWATSDAQLCSHPNKIIIIEEVDRIRKSRKTRRNEGNPVELAESRNTTFNNPLTVIMSTPLVEGKSYLYMYFNEGTRFLWCVLCTECDYYFFPDLPLLKWDKDKSKSFYDRAATVELECPVCKKRYTEFDIKRLSKSGKYLSSRTHLIEENDIIISKEIAKDIDFTDVPKNRTASYRVSGLVSWWRDWKNTVERFLQAVETKDDETLQAIVNVEFGKMFRLGGDPPKFDKIFKNRSSYKIKELNNTELPDNNIVAVIGSIDVQYDKFVYVFRAWNQKLDSWLVGYGELFGDTEKNKTWDQLELLLRGTKFLHNNKVVYPRSVFIDSGFNTTNVYAFCLRQNLRGRVIPIKGVGTDSMVKTIVGTNINIDTRNKLRARKKNIKLSNKERFILYKIKDSFYKSWVHTRIRNQFEEEKTWHLPDNISLGYCEELTNEYKTITAAGRETWLTKKGAHDYLDCEKINAAGAFILNLKDVIPEKSQGKIDKIDKIIKVGTMTTKL